MYTVGMDVDRLVFTVKILLYAGNSYINSPLIFIVLGTIYLLFEGQSAGNLNLNLNAMAQIYTSFKNLPSISEHVPIKKTLRDLNDEDFGYFLAGLIEADGWFGYKSLHISFSRLDKPLAYAIKKRIGSGGVYPYSGGRLSDKYICNSIDGLRKIVSLINGKLVSNPKYDQLIFHKYSEILDVGIVLPTNKLSLDNYWLSGFTQGDGCFYIGMCKSKSHKTGWRVTLEFSIKQVDKVPLELLYSLLKLGNLSYYNVGIWCYKSSGYLTSYVLINYFDKFSLFSDKYTNFLKFRKVYIMITEGKHLTIEGIKKIKKKRVGGSSETRTQNI